LKERKIIEDFYKMLHNIFGVFFITNASMQGLTTSSVVPRLKQDLALTVDSPRRHSFEQDDQLDQGDQDNAKDDEEDDEGRVTENRKLFFNTIIQCAAAKFGLLLVTNVDQLHQEHNEVEQKLF